MQWNRKTRLSPGQWRLLSLSCNLKPKNTMTRPPITPGPWWSEKSTSSNYDPRHAPVKSGPKLIAKAYFGKNDDEREANARAIAAVPALLEALELAETTLQRIAPDGSRATQGTRDVITAAFKLAGYEF